VLLAHRNHFIDSLLTVIVPQSLHTKRENMAQEVEAWPSCLINKIHVYIQCAEKTHFKDKSG